MQTWSTPPRQLPSEMEWKTLFTYFTLQFEGFRQATLKLAIALKINSESLRSPSSDSLGRLPILWSQWGRLCLSFPVSAGSPQGSKRPLTGPCLLSTPSFSSLAGPRPLQRLPHGPRSRAAALQPRPQAAASPGLAARSFQALRWPGAR